MNMTAKIHTLTQSIKKRCNPYCVICKKKIKVGEKYTSTQSKKRKGGRFRCIKCAKEVSQI